MLYEQGRYADAEKVLRETLLANAEDAEAHALLAGCLLQRDAFDEAEREARTAIGLDPEDASGFHMLGMVELARNDPKAAQTSFERALELCPWESGLHHLLGEVHFAKKRWQQALDCAEQGLEFDAEDIDCQNLRVRALVQLGRPAEANQEISDALRREPHNADSHATNGWTLLHASKPRPAIEHFKEALRLDPEHEFARAGIVEALKARNPIYGLMLRYFLWMERLAGKAFVLILVAFVLYRVALNYAKKDPEIGQWLWWVIYAYWGFVAMTWLAVPFFNLLLRLHPLGRHALSSEQKRDSTLVGSVLLTVASLFVWWRWQGSLFSFIAFVDSAFLGVAIVAYTSVPRGWPRKVLLGFVAAVVCGIGVQWGILTGQGDESRSLIAAQFRAWTAVAALWVSMLLSGAQPRR